MTTDEQLAFRALADFGEVWAGVRQRVAKAKRRPTHPATLAQLLAVIASSTSRTPRR